MGGRYSPYGLKQLLSASGLGLIFLAASHKQMSVLGLAALNLHELVKFQNPSFTTAIAFAPLVEDGDARVMDASLGVASVCALLVRSATCTSPACPSIGDLERWVIIVRLRRWGRWCARGRRHVDRGARQGRARVCSCVIGDLLYKGRV